MPNSNRSAKPLLDTNDIRNTDPVRFALIADGFHDIRTQLASARGYAKMTLEQRGGTLNREQQEYLGIIVQNMNRMIPLLNDLEDLATALPFSLENLEVEKLWRDPLRLGKANALLKSVQVRETVISESVFIRGDRQKLNQTFEAILYRIAQSTEPGGEILIEKSVGGGEVRLRISSRPSGDAQEAAVDEASGSEPLASHAEMDPELAEVRRIVRLHGGRCVLEKDAHGIAAFIIALPVRPLRKVK